MKGKFLEILAELKSCGYNVKCKLMNAMWYDVPQSRNRMIFIGTRNDLTQIKPSYPLPNKTFISFSQATEKCKDFSDRDFPEVLKKIGEKQPTNLWSSKPDIYKSIKGNSAGSFTTKWAINNNVLGTIIKDEISLTGIVHPNRQRYLNIDELKACSSFPINFVFTDRKNGIKRIGNSVPPNLMKAIASHIKTEILSKVA